MGEQAVVINQDKPDGTPQKLLDISQNPEDPVNPACPVGPEDRTGV